MERSMAPKLTRRPLTNHHLDRYDGFAAYAGSKARLFALQQPSQFAVFGCKDLPTDEIRQAEAGRRPAGRARSCGWTRAARDLTEASRPPLGTGYAPPCAAIPSLKR